ncbi:hypothetical protein M8J77_002437 [Diaphorina citri]|nr:hypothetical protein M8J77_002437 [Diaphorina citri]
MDLSSKSTSQEPEGAETRALRQVGDHPPRKGVEPHPVHEEPNVGCHTSLRMEHESPGLDSLCTNNLNGVVVRLRQGSNAHPPVYQTSVITTKLTRQDVISAEIVKRLLASQQTMEELPLGKYYN